MTRETIIELIRQLQNKTLDNGCTEAEAMSAAAKAGELMAKYNITLDVVYIGDTKCITIEIDCGFRTNYADYFITAVARYCDCKVYSKSDYNTKARKYCLFGLPIDAKMADYLYTVINRCMDVELGIFKSSQYYNNCGRKGFPSRRMASGSFLKGMAARIAARLDTMKAEIKAATSSSSTGIIVVKNDKVAREYQIIKDELGLTNNKTVTTKVNKAAYSSGQDAGNRVNLNRPLAGSTSTGYLT